ncbi:hypothetical protein [uncultured Agrobacterium sp.]|uniref:hypothetical protein n=1 Tax=uncultured Agrobacterium sp. TaxID=157277 RepID=UPI0025DBFF17|nr:hypothetical protein [uncultured Agrobacterium sp.]
MRIGVLVLLASVSASSAFAANIKPGPSETDYLFQCSATFIINAHALKDSGKSAKIQAKAAEYDSKFNKLATRARASFEENRRTKAEASAYLQKHVDTMSVLFAKEPEVMTRFVQQCDTRYQDTL